MLNFDYALTNETTQNLINFRTKINREILRRAEEKMHESEYLKKQCGFSDEEIDQLNGVAKVEILKEKKTDQLNSSLKNTHKARTLPKEGTKSGNAINFIFDHEKGATRDQVMKACGEANKTNFSVMMSKFTNVFVYFDKEKKLYFPIMESVAKE